MKRAYFIKPVGIVGPIKIGQSKAPAIRLQHLATWSPFPLEIVAEIEGDDELEERFHAAFLDHHSHLEWFHPHQDILAVIDQINAGTFDVDTLPYASGPLKGMRARHAKWKAIDYEYYGLWRQYARIHHGGQHGWRHGTYPASIFANMAEATKVAEFRGLHAFISKCSRPEQSTAA